MAMYQVPVDGGRPGMMDLSAEDRLQRSCLDSPPRFTGQRNEPHCSLREGDERPAHQFGSRCYHRHEPTPLPMPPLCATLTLTLLISQTLAEAVGKGPKQPPSQLPPWFTRPCADQPSHLHRACVSNDPSAHLCSGHPEICSVALCSQ